MLLSNSAYWRHVAFVVKGRDTQCGKAANSLGDVVHPLKPVCNISVSVAVQVLDNVVGLRDSLQRVLNCQQGSLLLKGSCLIINKPHGPGFYDPFLDCDCLPPTLGFLFSTA